MIGSDVQLDRHYIIIHIVYYIRNFFKRFEIVRHRHAFRRTFIVDGIVLAKNKCSENGSKNTSQVNWEALKAL